MHHSSFQCIQSLKLDQLDIDLVAKLFSKNYNKNHNILIKLVQKGIYSINQIQPIQFLELM